MNIYNAYNAMQIMQYKEYTVYKMINSKYNTLNIMQREQCSYTFNKMHRMQCIEYKE